MEAERVVASRFPLSAFQANQGHDSAMSVWMNRRRSSGRLIILHKCRPPGQQPKLLIVRVVGCRLLLVYGSAVVTLFRRVIIFPKNHSPNILRRVVEFLWLVFVFVLRGRSFKFW